MSRQPRSLALWVNFAAILLGGLLVAPANAVDLSAGCQQVDGAGDGEYQRNVSSTGFSPLAKKS